MAKKAKDPRPTWDAYFMEIAEVVAKRSNCVRRHVAAVIVNLIATKGTAAKESNRS